MRKQLGGSQARMKRLEGDLEKIQKQIKDLQKKEAEIREILYGYSADCIRIYAKDMQLLPMQTLRFLEQMKDYLLKEEPQQKRSIKNQEKEPSDANENKNP